MLSAAEATETSRRPTTRSLMPTRSRPEEASRRRPAIRPLYRLTVLFLAAALAGCDGSEPDTPAGDQAFDPAFEQQLETTVTTLFEELDVPGALVGLWVPGRGSWTTSLGVADLETGEPFAFENHVRIGSIT